VGVAVGVEWEWKWGRDSMGLREGVGGDEGLREEEYVKGVIGAFARLGRLGEPIAVPMMVPVVPKPLLLLLPSSLPSLPLTLTQSPPADCRPGCKPVCRAGNPSAPRAGA